MSGSSRVVIVIDDQSFYNVLRYLHYHLPSHYQRSLLRTESGIFEPLMYISEQSFLWNEIEFSINTCENYRKTGGTFERYSELVIEHDSITVISDFIQLCSNYIQKQLFRTEISIFKSEYSTWVLESLNFKKRPLESLYLPKKVKNDLIEDITKFYDPSVVERYSKLGINHVRIYLFYGPPGTGKTTAIKTIASHFKKNICFMSNERDLCDYSFKKSITILPSNSILCLEDIDCFFGEDRTTKNNLTFGNIINTLDGITTPDNTVLFMTTNYINKLDSSIKRRCGYFVEFDYATKEQISEMFAMYFPNADFGAFYKNIGDTKVSINILEKFFVKHLFDEDIVSTSKTFSKFANSELKIETDNGSKLYT